MFSTTSFALAAGLALLLSAIVAVQARRRGYSLLVWLAAGALGNPLFFLVLLAMMPDRARQALRRRLRAELEAKLAARHKVLPVAAPTLPAGALPPTRSDVRPGVSVGDAVTVAPPERSLGDEETRA
jgi:hypothetical protein